MMSRVVLLVTAAAMVGFARPALAQSALKDVPAQHWASGAVKELQSRGIITGYPDGTFGGQRAVTRYEFAQAMQRTLQVAQRRIDAAAAAPHPSGAVPGVTREEMNRMIAARMRNLPTRSEVDQIRASVDEIRHTMGDLQSRAARLRYEVDQIRQQVGSMSSGISSIRSQLPLESGHRR